MIRNIVFDMGTVIIRFNGFHSVGYRIVVLISAICPLVD